MLQYFENSVIIFSILSISLYFVSFFSDKKNTKAFIYLLLVFQGFSITFLSNKLDWFLGFFLICLGVYSLFGLISKEILIVSNRSYGSRLLNYVAKKINIKFWFPVTGLALIIADLILNYMLLNGRIGGNDMILLVLSFSLISYPYINDKYVNEKNFFLFFIVSLFLLLVFPLTFYNFF